MSTPPTRIASIPPPFPDDPYLTLFYRALEGHGFALEADRRRYLQADAFHFHWLHLFYDRPGQVVALVRWLWMALRLIGLRILGYRLIWTVHNLESHERKHPALDRASGWLMARLAHAVLAHGEAGARAVAERFGRPDVVRLPLFSQGGHYPDTVDRAAARDRLGIPPDAFAIVALGKLRAYKGADRLVEDFRARARESDRLLVAGRPETPAIEAHLEALAADPRIQLHARFVPDAEVQLYYRAADVAVFPYRDILTAGAVGVALAFGVPVVAPRRGSVPEAVGDGGVLYDPDDADALWRAIETVRAGDRAALSAAARARSADLSFEHVAQVAAVALREKLR